MARLPRLVWPGAVHWLAWIGHRQQAVFHDEADRRTFLSLMQEQLSRHELALHAYVLLDNEVQFLATPGTAAALSLWMQALGRAYGRRFNQRHGVGGTLWEGRFRSVVVQEAVSARAWLALDLAPLHRGLVQTPQAHAWGSQAYYRGERSDVPLTPPAHWWSLGNTPFEREAAYAQRLQTGMAASEWEQLQAALRSGWPLGTPEFLQTLQQQTGQRVTRDRPGRPRKNPLD